MGKEREENTAVQNVPYPCIPSLYTTCSLARTHFWSQRTRIFVPAKCFELGSYRPRALPVALWSLLMGNNTNALDILRVFGNTCTTRVLLATHAPVCHHSRARHVLHSLQQYHM